MCADVGRSNTWPQVERATGIAFVVMQRHPAGDFGRAKVVQKAASLQANASGSRADIACWRSHLGDEPWRESA